jgi:hypothetical protein
VREGGREGRTDEKTVNEVCLRFFFSL